MGNGDTTVGFLNDLFGAKLPDDLQIALWTKATKKTDYLQTPSAGEQFAERKDVYVHAGLAIKTAPKSKRPSLKHIGAIPGVWADLDVKGGPDDPIGKLLAPSVEAAIVVAQSILKPTIIVHSGYGVQAWWLLDDLFLIKSDEDREQAERLVKGFQRLLRNNALDQGWGVDSTHDLPRLMRLPGTLNDKGPEGTTAPVRVLEEDGPRFSFEEIASHSMAAAPVRTSTQINLSENRKLPMGKFEALKDNNELFEKTWEHKRRKENARGWSISEYDLSLASMAVNAGWKDDEVAELIAEHRRKYNGPDDTKASRSDYLARTIARARQDARIVEREEYQAAALDDLAHMADSETGVVDPSRAISLFNTILSGGREGAPVVKELVQYGVDPDDARYVLVLADGKEINVGTYVNLRDPRKLDSRVGPATGFVMSKVKDDDRWVSALTALLRIATVREESEDKVREWVKRYIDDRMLGGKEESAAEGEPFEDNGFIHIKSAALARYARSVMRERLSQADLTPLLRQAGFQQATIHYETKNGKRSTASYWSIAKEDLL